MLPNLPFYFSAFSLRVNSYNFFSRSSIFYLCLGQFWHSVFYCGSSDAFFLYFWADLLIIRFSLLRPPTSVGLLTYFELFGSILMDAILYIFGYVDEDWTFKVYIYFYFSLINLLALNSILLRFFSFSEICFIFLLPS